MPNAFLASFASGAGRVWQSGGATPAPALGRASAGCRARLR
jgi:hypothetical protein